MSLEPLRHILSRTIRTAATSTDLQIARVFDVSKTVLARLWGDERAAYVQPVSFKEGTLKMETASPAAKQQLGIDSIRFKNEINRQLDRQVVKTVLVQGKGC